MSKSNKFAFETRAIHAGQKPDPLTGAVVTPIYTASTFEQDSIGENRGFMYSRVKNPTRSTLEACLADLEGAASALACPTGLSAAATILELLDAGDHLIAHHDLYGGIYRLFAKVRNRSAALNVDFVDFADVEAVRQALRPDTKMLWFETPSNPLLDIVDMAAMVELAASVGAMTVCDNTFCSSYCQRPIAHGVDIVMHSATKFLGGHSDLLAGVIAISPNVREGLAEELAFLQNSVGAALDPTTASTLLRSLKTLPVRMDRHLQNTATIAQFLADNKPRLGIERLIYPGLADHPGREIARRQMLGFGSMISFTLNGGAARANQIAQSLELFTYAVSLGGVESLVQHPASMTHKIVPPEQRDRLGVTDNFLRLSIGIEHVDDLIRDLDTTLSTN